MQQRNQAFARVVMPGLRSSCYSRAASPWSTRDMPNVHNLYPIIENAVKNFEGILDERHHVEAGPLFDLGRAERVSADAIDDGPDAGFKSARNPVAECAAAVGGNLAKIGDGAVGVLNLHARRNVRNAASTSSSVAIPLRSASSMAASSAGVAWYTPLRRASIARAYSASSS
jgi:hypothetical protein